MSELEARRAQLRALSAESDVAALEQALSGADEEARRSLSRTLPPSRLIRQEGPTPRACYALTALGKPSFVAETLTETDLGSRPSEWIEAAVAALLAAAADRTQQWRSDFVEAFALEFWWSGQRVVWPVLSALVHGYGIEPTAAYLDRFVSTITDEAAAGGSPDEVGSKIAERLRVAPQLQDDFWALFRVEGPGSNYLLLEAAAQAWEVAVLALATDPPLRSRLLDESLAALARDFTARHTGWYRRVHQTLKPTPAEIADRADRYLGLLSSEASTTVGLALAALTPAARLGLLVTQPLVEAAGTVLGRTEKKLLKAQLSLLGSLDLATEQSEQVAQLVAEVASAWTPDLVKAARDLLPDTTAVSSPAPGSGAPIEVPPPRSEPLPPLPTAPELQSDAELFELVAEQLEGVGPGADLPRILSYLADHPDLAAPTALASRARQLLDHRPTYDLRDEAAASPRRQLAAVLLGDANPQFRGYCRYVVVSADQATPSGVTLTESTATSARLDHESGQWIQESWTSRSGYQYFPTNSTTALLAETMRKARLFRKAGRRFTLPSPPPPTPRDWVRELRTPGAGTFSRDLEVLGQQPRVFWLAGPEPADQNTEFNNRALSVADVPVEFTFRAQEAREQDGFDQLVGWAGWLLQHNPDTLAAQFHPALYAATAVVNVRGVAELLASLGACRQLPGAPTYSALGLGCSAKEQTHRAAAAEAVAALSDNGLLEPAAFATQLSLLLSEGFAQSGRVTQTLADTATISALAGYRVLLTLIGLVPSLTEIRQPAPLASLLARLAREYGTAVELPAPLQRRAKSGTVLGAALAELASVRPSQTDLAGAAAEAAAAALGRAHGL